MKISSRMQATGRLLFRWRSYLPIAFAAVLVPALLGRPKETTADLVCDLCVLSLASSGLLVRCLTVGYAAPRTSGRNTEDQVAKSLNTLGMYSIVRHPLYLGNFLIWLGLSLDLMLWWFPLVAALAFWLYYERIAMAEEAFLEAEFGAAFLAWAERTPAFAPDPRLWRRPERAFAWRRVVRREYHTLAGILVAFAGLEVISDCFDGAGFRFEIEWLAPLSAGVAIYLTAKALRCWTTVLDS